MAKAPERTCPSLYRLIDRAEPQIVAGFLDQDEFQREQWLEKYRSSSGVPVTRARLDELLRKEKKVRLEPLDREAARVLSVAEMRGQYALEGLVKTRLKPAEQAAIRRQKDELSRSLWAYLNNRLLFDAVDSVLHLQLYRRYGKHYQRFPVGGATGTEGADPAEALDRLIKEIEARLDRGSGCRIERFDLPARDGHPAAEMYIVYHPNPLTSAREIREDGERRTIYFRPPGEATIVFTPATGIIEVRADTKVIREDVAESFAEIALGQKLSREPCDSRDYDLSRFFDSFELDCPEVDGFHITKARVIRAEVSVRHLGNRLSLSTTINDDIDALIDGQPGMRAIFRRAVAIRFIEIVVRYRRSGDRDERTLDFTISDQNSCSLLSLPDEGERILGHRLLRHWNVLREFRQPAQAEQKRLMPALLELWNSGDSEVPGSWLQERAIDEALMTSAGLLTPIGWEEVDLIDDEDSGQVDARVFTEEGRAYLEPTSGQEVGARAPARYRKFRVDHGWLPEHLRSALSEALDETLIEDLSSHLFGLGSLHVDSSTVPVYLVRRLDDPTVLADSDRKIRGRSNLGTGLVLSAVKEPYRCLAANVLSPLPRHLAEADRSVVISADTLRTAFRNNRILAQGGQAVELIWDGGKTGELFVPRKGSIQIDGRNRLIVIDRLVKAYQSGVRRRKSGELTKDFEGQALQNIFGRDLWRRLTADFIRQAGYGYWEIAA